MNTAVGYGFFVLIQWLIGFIISYLGSLLLSHLLSSVLAFTLYRIVVFRVRGHIGSDFLRFQLIYLLPLSANIIVLPILVSVLHWDVYLSQAVIVVVSAIVSFLGHKYFSFRRKSEAPKSPSSPLMKGRN